MHLPCFPSLHLHRNSVGVPTFLLLVSCLLQITLKPLALQRVPSRIARLKSFFSHAPSYSCRPIDPCPWYLCCCAFPRVSSLLLISACSASLPPHPSSPQHFAPPTSCSLSSSLFRTGNAVYLTALLHFSSCTFEKFCVLGPKSCVPSRSPPCSHKTIWSQLARWSHSISLSNERPSNVILHRPQLSASHQAHHVQVSNILTTHPPPTGYRT